MAFRDRLTDRQSRELAYHKEHAELVAERFGRLSHEVVYSVRRRWWNAYWDVFFYIRNLDLNSKRVLVVGCGAGEDAVRLAKLGADVDAFDLSPEMLEIASRLAATEDVLVRFSEMSAEMLDYPSDYFDVIFVRDILHHVDIPKAMSELRRVGTRGGIVVVNEIYSHSITEFVRRSDFVENFVYPRMRGYIYGPDKPYITADERKLSEHDVKLITEALNRPVRQKYFNFVVTRLLPDRYDLFCKFDRALLIACGALARFLAGRIVIFGTIAK